MAESSHRDGSTENGDEPRPGAGTEPPVRHWWWSPTLMIVVGVAVIFYQYRAIAGEGAIILNWILVVIGGAVAVAGLVSLRRAWDVERSGASKTPPGTPQV